MREANPYRKSGLAAIMMALFATAASAQSAAVPDFSLAGAGWATSIAGDFLPVPGSASPLRSDPAQPFLTNVEARERGLTPGYRIGDLSNPNLRPDVKEAMRKDNAEVLAGRIAYTPSTSCEPAGVPWFLLQPSLLYFVQGPKEVVMIQAYDSQVRHIFLDVPHSANVKPSWYGESIGHYEEGTLVVDTVGLNAKTFVDAYRTPHSDKLHVIERWKLLDGGNALEVAMTVDDPQTYYQPWEGTLRYRKTQEPIQEAICAENNLQFDYHMPVAAKTDF